MARKAGVGTWLPLELNGDEASPLFQRLYRELRQAVLDGRLRPGARLAADAGVTIDRPVRIFVYGELESDVIVGGTTFHSCWDQLTNTAC